MHRKNKALRTKNLNLVVFYSEQDKNLNKVETKPKTRVKSWQKYEGAETRYVYVTRLATEEPKRSTKHLFLEVFQRSLTI